MKTGTSFVVLFTVSVLLLGAVAGPLNLIPTADALKGKGVPSSQYGSATKGIVCGDKLCSEVKTVEPKKEVKKETVKTEKKETEKKKIEDKVAAAQERYDETALPPRTIKSGTLTSTQDPGQGHENHQLAIILEPRTTAYYGTLGYSASENVQLVALHGPLQPGQEQHGQPIWSPDGKTFYALSFVDKENSMGTWQFAANAIALHTMKNTPFTVSYSVATGQ